MMGGLELRAEHLGQPDGGRLTAGRTLGRPGPQYVSVEDDQQASWSMQ